MRIHTLAVRYIRDIYAAAQDARRPVLSFEFFTPKTPEGDSTFFGRTMPALAELSPDYCSVTYGAGGSTRNKTLEMVEQLQREFRIPAMAHLTCVGSTRDRIVQLLEEARRRGILNVLALRGDPPAGAETFKPTDGGFNYAHELVTLTRNLGGFSIGVAGFPEGHVECREGRWTDWERLAAKIQCGADFVISQLFFDNAHFYAFRDYLAGRLGIRVPIVPGVIPILSSGQIRKFIALCGATVPRELTERLDALAHDDAAALEFGVEFATRQCEDLLRNGAPGIHFYTLNRSLSTRRILENLGLRKAQPAGTPGHQPR